MFYSLCRVSFKFVLKFLGSKQWSLVLSHESDDCFV